MLDYGTESDECLAAAAQGGDEEALRALLERHRGPLQAVLLRRIPPALRRKISVADVLQEVYAGAWTSLSGFQDRGLGSFRAWLLKITEFKAKNVIRNLLRDRRDVRREAQVETAAVREHHGAREASPSSVAIAKELERRLAALVSSLKPDYRQVLALVLVEGLSMAEAGERMGRSANATQKLYQRAKDHLWADCYGEGGTAS
jgi:RNA polymerase sigma-70 factor (ECF subfamily)